MSNNLDGTWIVAAYRSGDELVTPDEHAPQAVLTIDGASISGTMGINRFAGRVEGGLVVSPLATTRMAGPPDLMDQESTLLRHLAEADLIEVDGDGMTMGKNGLNTVELRR
ncbi:MAG: META domain-containing protein, partial [Acidimicrobiia bacterium]